MAHPPHPLWARLPVAPRYVGVRNHPDSHDFLAASHGEPKFPDADTVSALPCSPLARGAFAATPPVRQMVVGDSRVTGIVTFYGHLAKI